jgi:hypothetical protein
MDDALGSHPSNAAPTVFTAVGGPVAGSTNSIGTITQPIAAWRLTNNSTGGTVTVAALQFGVG